MNPPRPPGPHPAAEELLRAHRAPADPASRPALDHAALCAACSEELAAIEAFAPRSDPFGAEARRAEAAWARFTDAPAAVRPVRRLAPALAMAAAICLAFAVPLLLRRPEVDAPRGATAAPGGFSPSGDVPAPPSAFRIPRGGNAAVRVSVFDAERRFTWTSEPSPPGKPVPFPEAERKKLRPGVPYTWIVLGGGTLPPHTFTIRR